MQFGILVYYRITDENKGLRNQSISMRHKFYLFKPGFTPETLEYENIDLTNLVAHLVTIDYWIPSLRKDEMDRTEIWFTRQMS